MHKKIFTALLLPALILMGFAGAPSAHAAIGEWQKAAAVDPRWTTDFSSDSFKQSLRNLAAANANMVTLIIPYYQSNIWSADLNPGWNTPTDASLADAIDFAHSLGLQVTLKPHLESYDGTWRANIKAGDRDAWYKAYGDMIVHYASIGQAHGAEQFVVGSELIDTAAATTNPDNTARWKGMIARVRGVFSGKLTYSANWGGSWWADEKNHIEFWDVLDYIGISGYFVLDTDLNQQALMAKWENWKNSDIGPLQARWGKPVLFTEVGYRSMSGARYEPFNSWDHWGVSEYEQAQLYEAFFGYWNNQSFMKGAHFWHWISDPNAGGSNNDEYTPQNKSALQTISSWWARGDAGTPPPPPAPGVTCAAPAVNAFTGCYYDNPNFDSLKVSRTDSSVNFNWEFGSPDPLIGADTFSVRWTGRFNFSAADYKFDLRTDDGAKLLIDGAVVLDKWFDQGASDYSVTRGMTSGEHTIELQYYENGGHAVAALNWNQVTAAPPPPPPATSTPTSTPPAAGSIDVWWPTNGAVVGGTTPFKAMLENWNVNDYRMFWQVDGDRLNVMETNLTDYPHKESLVDLSGWSWNGDGPYHLNFVAQDLSGNTLSTRPIDIRISR